VSESEQREAEADFRQGKETVVLPALVITRSEVIVRCVQLATGQVVYDFTQPGTERLTRYDADAYESAINYARDRMEQQERA
jgi:hypothetical protein